jgi:hypothetical protein|tara:strand:- start:732 stop:1163 length:432 start_codon:yes stop_codon:yes gene_type:complete
MNEIIVKLYEEFFDWNTYQGLLNMVFNNHDYGKIGWLILIIPIIILIIFYKFWDPVSSSKLKWWLTILSISILGYISASTVLYNNTKIIQYLGNYTGGNGQPDADYFIIQMSLMTLVYSLIIAFILSIIPFRLISSNNRNNPF